MAVCIAALMLMVTPSSRGLSNSIIVTINQQFPIVFGLTLLLSLVLVLNFSIQAFGSDVRLVILNFQLKR